MKFWTLLRVTTPILFSLMTACGVEKQALQIAASQFTGTWLSEKAAKVFDQFRNNPNNFCDQVRNQPELGWEYGQAANANNLFPTALEVRSNGDVFKYQVQNSYGNAQYAFDNRIGHVADDGRLNNFSLSALAGSGTPQLVRADADHIWFGTGSSGQLNAYVKINTQELNNYLAQLRSCSTSGTGNYQQPNAGWQQGYPQPNTMPTPGSQVGNPNMTYLPPQQPMPQGGGQLGSDYGADYGNGANNGGYQFGPAPQGGYQQ